MAPNTPSVWPPPETFADRFARLRRAKRATNAEIAAACGVAKNTVSNWMGGQKPEGKPLLALARYFEVPAEWLLDGVLPVDNSRDRDLVVEEHRTLHGETAHDKAAKRRRRSS